VTIELTDQSGEIRPGMTAAVNVVVEQLDDVLLVPNRAVRLKGGQRVVYVMRDGVSTAVNLTIGSISDSDSQILSGDVKEGDLIVLNPPVEFNLSQPPSGSFAR
jgi:HlyD family secretion protein